MAEQIAVARTAEELIEQFDGSTAAGGNAAVLCELGGGVLRFAGAVYPGASLDQVYATVNEREAQGRGPHFDVYGPYVDGRYPLVGVYNLAGSADIRTTLLPPELALIYAGLYPQPDDAAFRGRRNLADIALNANPDARVYSGVISPGTGLVLPQPLDGPHVVHDIVPKDHKTPGSFVKLVVPNDTPAAAEKIAEGGYKTLDELVTEGLGGVAIGVGPEPQTVLELPPSEESEEDEDIGHILRPPSGQRLRRPTHRRRCNLD